MIMQNSNYEILMRQGNISALKYDIGVVNVVETTILSPLEELIL